MFLMTVQEAHKEYNSLMDQIRAKYEQLDSDEYGAVGTPVFNPFRTAVPTEGTCKHYIVLTRMAIYNIRCKLPMLSKIV